MLKDKEEEDVILKEIESVGDSTSEAQKLILEMKIERVEEIMRTARTTMLVSVLIAAGAALMVYLWDDQSRGGRGYNYFVGAIFLPVIFLAAFLYYRTDRNALRFELSEKNKEWMGTK